MGCQTGGSSSQTLRTEQTKQRISIDPSAPSCGLVVLDPPSVMPVNPCIPGPGVETVLGPESFTRRAGPPNDYSRAFSGPATGEICVRSVNEGAHGSVTIDGAQVIGPRALKPSLRDAQARLALAAGAHDLGVRLTGSKNRTATVTLLHTDALTQPHHPVTGVRGLIRVSNLQADTPLIRPSKTSRSRIRAVAHVIDFAGSLEAYAFRLDYEVQIIAEDGCLPVRTLTGTVPVSGKDVSYGVSVIWDGADDSGDPVAAGTYYYTMHVALKREKLSSGVVQQQDSAQTQVQAFQVAVRDDFEWVTTVNLNDHDQMLDLVCVRSTEEIDTVRFTMYELGQQTGQIVRDISEAVVTRKKTRYDERCFGNIPTYANPVLDSEIDLRVEILRRDVLVRDPFVLSPPPPPLGDVEEPLYEQPLLATGVLLASGESVTARTSATQGAFADPLIHIVEVSASPDRTVAGNDDHHLGTVEASTHYTNNSSSTKTIRIYVLPSETGAHGITTLTAETGTTTEVLADRGFGGRYLELGQRARERLHVAAQPGGPADYELLLLERWPGGSQYSHVIDRLTSYTVARYLSVPDIDSARRFVFVAPLTVPQTDPGKLQWNRLRVYSNDVDVDLDPDAPNVTRDWDGDGMGYELEATLGTCDDMWHPVERSPGELFNCATVTDQRDTDGDGLLDHWEVFGVHVDDTQDPGGRYGVDLPRFGADPRHKDMFFEMDGYLHWDPTHPSNADCSGNVDDIRCWRLLWTTPREALEANGLYEDSGEFLNNPDGDPGVRLHFDIGSEADSPYDCSVNSQVCRHWLPYLSTLCEDQPSLCGDWGGADIDLQDYEDPSGAMVPFGDRAVDVRYFALTRRRWGIFRHGYAATSSSASYNTDRFKYYVGSGRTLAHEVGHTLTLRHGGSPAAGEVNCKPHYQSIMNYLYQGASEVDGFSRGQNLYAPHDPTQLLVFNPVRLYEGYGNGPNTVDLADLQVWYQIYVDPYEPSAISQGGVDWNRDSVVEPGSLDPGDPAGSTVQGMLYWTGGDRNCDTAHYKDYLVVDFEEPSPGPGPGRPVLLAQQGESGRVLVTLYINHQGDLVYKTSDANYNSCRDIDVLAPDCGGWSEESLLLAQDPDWDYSRFAAATYQRDIFVVFPASGVSQTAPSNQLHFTIVSGDLEVGSISAPSPQPLHPDAKVYSLADRPEVVVANGKPWVFYAGPFSCLRQLHLDMASGWVEGAVYDKDNLQPCIPIELSPAATTAPDGLGGSDRIYLAVKTDLDADPLYEPRLYLFEHDQHDLWTTGPIEFPHYLKYDPPLTPNYNTIDRYDPLVPIDDFALAYVADDHVGGGLVAEDEPGSLSPWPGRLMLMYAHPADRTVSMAFSNPYDYFSWMRRGWASNYWREAHTRSEPGGRAGFSLLAEPGVDGNPRAAFKTKHGDTPGDIIFWPYVDGIRDIDLYDHNDWLVIRHYVCESIVRHRCHEDRNPGSCWPQAADQRVQEICGTFVDPTPYPPSP